MENKEIREETIDHRNMGLGTRIAAHFLLHASSFMLRYWDMYGPEHKAAVREVKMALFGKPLESDGVRREIDLQK